MTLQEFNLNYTPLIRVGLMFLGLGSIILVWYQIKISTKWNRLKEALNFLNNSRLTEYEEQLIQKVKGKYDLSCEIDLIKATEIYNSNDMYYSVKKYLDEIEKIAAAVNIGAFDYDFAYATYSPKIICNCRTFKNFISLIRMKNNDNEIYIEFEKLALDWEIIYLKYNETVKEKMERKTRKLLELSGVKKKI